MEQGLSAKKFAHMTSTCRNSYFHSIVIPSRIPVAALQRIRKRLREYFGKPFAKLEFPPLYRQRRRGQIVRNRHVDLAAMVQDVDYEQFVAEGLTVPASIGLIRRLMARGCSVAQFGIDELDPDQPDFDVSGSANILGLSDLSQDCLDGCAHDRWLEQSIAEKPYPRSLGRRLSRTQSAAVGKLSTSALATGSC